MYIILAGLVLLQVLIDCGHTDHTKPPSPFDFSSCYATPWPIKHPSTSGLKIIGYITSTLKLMQTHIIQNVVSSFLTLGGFISKDILINTCWKRVGFKWFGKRPCRDDTKMGIWRIEVSLGDRHLYVVSNSMFVLHECFELFCINTVVFILPASFVFPAQFAVKFWGESYWLALFVAGALRYVFVLHCTFLVSY